MIQVSETAKKRVISLMTEEGFDASEDYVRVGVKSGGCSGLSYELDFDDKINESYKVFEDNAVRILVDKKSFLYLVGTVLEYSGGLNGKGFVFNNPNAQHLWVWRKFFIIKGLNGIYRRGIKERARDQRV